MADRAATPGSTPASGATQNDGEKFASRASRAEAQLRHERDLLAGALGGVLVASGVANDVSLTGPQLLLLANELAEHLTARPRWTGAMVQSRAIELAATALREANRYPRADGGGDAAWQSIVKEITERDALAVVQVLYEAGMLREPTR